MANYSLANSTAIGGGVAQSAVATTYKSLLLVGNSTTSGASSAGQLRRGKIYDILVGTNGTPADQVMEWDLVRATMGASSTGTAGVSSLSSNFALDQADSNFIALAGINSTGETLYSALTEQWYVGVNQRASYRWVAAPGSEFVYPANSSATGINGFLLRTRSASGYTGTATGNILFNEQ